MWLPCPDAPALRLYAEFLSHPDMDFTDTITENTLRAIRFERPQYIPVVFWINPACWHHYHKDVLLELMAEHRILFAEFKPPSAWRINPEREPLPQIAPWERAGVPYTDAWGCIWEIGTLLNVLLRPIQLRRTAWAKLIGLQPTTESAGPSQKENTVSAAWNTVMRSNGSAICEGSKISYSI